ncbi:MAG: hypothetical protein GEU90_07835 [Gemmatimonas sp.]|nr:hypothetical protein [Gemmatimonas sp.]
MYPPPVPVKVERKLRQPAVRLLDTMRHPNNLMQPTAPIPGPHLPRLWPFAVLLAIVQGSCTIEQTPQEYIDHLTTPAAELEVSRDELMVRLLSTAPALERRDRLGVSGALAPGAEVFVLGLRPGEQLTTPRAVVDTLVSLIGGSDVGIGEAVVTVAPGNDVAWFRVAYDLPGSNADSSTINFSGVFVRAEGDWRLTHGHLSGGVSSWPPDPAPPPNPEPADTPAADG